MKTGGIEQSAARGDDTLSLLLGASSAGLQNDLTLDKALASHFGQYQIDWRQQSSMSSGQKTQEVAWATNVKAARDSYFTALGGAATDFDGTLTGAIQTYYDDMLTAQIDRSQSHFDALHAHYNALESAGNAYSVAAFTAAKEASLKYLDAEIKRVVDDAKAKVDVYKTEAAYYEGVVATCVNSGDLTWLLAELARIDAKLQAHIKTFSPTMSPGDLLLYNAKLLQLQTDRTNLLTQIASATTTATTTYTTVTANNGVANRESNAENAIAAAKIANEQIRDAAFDEIETAYYNAENAAWNIYYVSAIAADVTYLNTYQQIEKKFSNARSLTANAFDNTVIQAWFEYDKDMAKYDTQFLTAISHAGDANFNVNDWFNNGGSQDNYARVTLIKQGDDGKGEKDNDRFAWINFTKNGINARISAGFKWVANLTPFGYAIYNSTDEANLHSDILANRYNRISRGEKISQKELDFAKSIPDPLLDAVVAGANIDILAAEIITGTVALKYSGIRIAKVGETAGTTRATRYGVTTTVKVLPPIESLPAAERARLKALGTGHDGIHRLWEEKAAYKLEGLLGKKLERYPTSDLDWILPKGNFAKNPYDGVAYDLIGGQNIPVEKLSKKQIAKIITDIKGQIGDHLTKVGKDGVVVIDVSAWDPIIKDEILKFLVKYKDEISSGRIILWLE